MVRSVNVKKTKSSKKIVLKITMSMTCPHFFQLASKRIPQKVLDTQNHFPVG